jgi:ubiquinone/menaquinone biosynthesis C-methylase UbiE
MKKNTLINLNEILAYKRIKSYKKDHALYNSAATLKTLSKISKKSRGLFFDDLKIYMVLSVKYYFDFLAKTGKNPNLLLGPIKFWQDMFLVFSQLTKHNWIIKDPSKFKRLDVWKRTRKAFNYMWPKNVKDSLFNSSKVLADLRMNQIFEILPAKKFITGKVVLDSGCGPARYIDSILKYKPKKVIGIDSGASIIRSNKFKFRKQKNIKFINSRIDKLPLKNNSVDFIISAGVLHHTKTSISKTISEHCRVLKPGGVLFVFIVGQGGQELDLWKFCREVMADVDIKHAFQLLNKKISHLRLQGFLDHSYGEYKSTNKKFFQKILKRNFSFINEIKGVKGADVTKFTFKYDKFFSRRFGSGHLRYLCVK